MGNKLVRLKLDQDALGYSAVMEQITRAQIKDCFKEGDLLFFVVAPGELGKAIGKGGSNIRMAQARLGKRIRVVEFRENPAEFVKNLIYPLAVEEIVVEGKEILIKDQDKKIKGQIVGRDRSNLNFINKALQRFFDLEVKVV